MAYLGPKGALNERFLEASHYLFDAVLGHRPSNELVKQFGWNSRQRRLRRSGGLYFLWHICSFWSYYASNTKFLIGHMGPVPSRSRRFSSNSRLSISPRA